MGFIKTGDATPVEFFDSDGEQLSEEELKRMADSEKIEEQEDEDKKETNS